MKLPMLDLKKINRLNLNKKSVLNLEKNRHFINKFIPQENSIFTNLTDRKRSLDASTRNCYQTQKIFRINNSIKEKLSYYTKIKDESINCKNTTNSVNSYNYKSSSRTSINNGDNNYNDNESSKSDNYEKYIKKVLSSFKIKKEISSFLYSSPDKQKRLIKYLSCKINNNNNDDDYNTYYNNSINSSVNNKISKKYRMQQKFINITIKDNKKAKDKKIEADEDKTNLKEISLFSIMLGKKNYKLQSKIKYKKIDKKNYIKGWDNNLLKNLLPRNIKNQSIINSKNREINNYKEKISEINAHLTCRINELNSLNIHSIRNNILNKYKYRYNFGNVGMKKAFINSIKRQKLVRAFSNL